MGPAVSLELMDIFSKFIEDSIGLYFPKERAQDLERAVCGASAQLGCKDPEAFIRSFLLSPLSRAQTEALASHLTVGETYFFREEKTFTVLKEQILPGLIRGRRANGRYLRIWSAGCATGEEPYSIAILLHRMLPDFRDWNISILATDINPCFLQKAEKGIYGEWSFRNTPHASPAFRERYFRKIGKNRFELLPHIKDRVTFKYLNLAGGAYPSLANGTNAMDIIFCRNVLMYFSRIVQEEASKKFYNSLIDGGWLAVSPVETSAGLFSLFAHSGFPGVPLYKKTKNGALSRMKEVGNAGTGPPDYPHLTPYMIYRETETPTEEDIKTVTGTSMPAPETRLKNEAEEDNTPVTGHASYQNALDLYRKGRFGEARDEAERILVSGKEDAGPLVLLARIYADEGKLDAAVIMCEKAISSSKLDPVPYYLLAVIQQEMGLPEKSADTLKKTIYLDPGFVLAYFFLGDIARRQGKIRESKKYFKNALSALNGYGRDDLIPESDGLTAGRLTEIINNNMREMSQV